MADEVKVVRDDEKHRYEVLVEGTVAGFTEFVADAGGRLIFPHTEIDPAFGGRGLGSLLIGRAMADVAARDETVVPVCPFVVKYLQQHEVPDLAIRWRPRDVEAAEAAPLEDRLPADEGVGTKHG